MQVSCPLPFWPNTWWKSLFCYLITLVPLNLQYPKYSKFDIEIKSLLTTKPLSCWKAFWVSFSFVKAGCFGPLLWRTRPLLNILFAIKVDLAKLFILDRKFDFLYQRTNVKERLRIKMFGPACLKLSVSWMKMAGWDDERSILSQVWKININFVYSVY